VSTDLTSDHLHCPFAPTTAQFLYRSDFLIATQDELAIAFNDRSPAEQHHASTCFRLLRNKELNFVHGLSKAERDMLRKVSRLWRLTGQLQ
jgi:hypothetical protein